MAGGIDHFCVLLTENTVVRIEYEWKITEAEMTLEGKLHVAVYMS